MGRIRRILGQFGLFVSLYCYGMMMGPREVYFTRTRAATAWWSALLALLAVLSISNLIPARGAAQGSGREA